LPIDANVFGAMCSRLRGPHNQSQAAWCTVQFPFLKKNEIERHGCMVVTKCSLNRVLSCSQRVAMTPTAAFHALLALSSLSPISAAAWGGRASRTVGVPPDAAAIVGVGSEIPDTMQYRQAVSPSAASSEQQSPLRSVTSADQPFGRPMLAEFMLANYTNLNHGSFGATPRAGEFAHRSCTAYMSLQHESKISALFMLSHTTWPHRALRSSGSLVQLPSLDNIGCGQSLARLWSLYACSNILPVRVVINAPSTSERTIDPSSHTHVLPCWHCALSPHSPSACDCHDLHAIASALHSFTHTHTHSHTHTWDTIILTP
jgi:hypothetical protein